MRIIFDFDYTLFNAKKLREAIKAVFLCHSVNGEVFEKTYEQSRAGKRDWHPQVQLEILKNDHGIKSTDQIAEKMREILARCDMFLYDDTVPFLGKVSSNNKLALVSYGEDSFQNAKVDGCSTIRKYFDRIVITQNIYKDKEVAELAEGGKAIFVEDNPVALSAAKKIGPQIITVRMKRGEGRYANEISQEGIDYEVKGLFELYETCLSN